MTLIIGCVVYVKPAQVSRVPFTRDVAFLVMALLLVLLSASMGRISVSTSPASCVIEPLRPWGEGGRALYHSLHTTRIELE